MSHLQKKLLLINPVSRVELPESVDLDGANDYLSRASDFIGNTDSKTFTFSAWVYRANITSNVYLYSNTGDYIYIYTDNNGYLAFNMKNAANTVILEATLASAIPYKTFTHILVSVDLANLTNRHMYINDILVSPSWTTYSNDIIDFTKVDHYINRAFGAIGKICRISHVFLDYTYRDLSVEANRRLFITEDLKPTSGQAALNPIMYLPMTDPDTWFINEGTGGNMTANGVVAQSRRGPNQDNCVTSEFDGVADYLSKTGISGLSDSRLLTFAGILKSSTTGQSLFTLQAVAGATTYPRMSVYRNSNTDKIWIIIEDSSGTNVNIQTNNFPAAYQIALQVSLDTADINKTRVIINGISQTLISNTSAGRDIQFSGFTASNITADYTNSKYDGDYGEIWVEPGTYKELATDNPFWDSELNLSKPVHQIIEETGITPLMALPIRADDAGKNLGTGGDFTVNSGPFIGARGASEFWARSMNAIGSTNYLSIDGSGFGTTKTLTIAFAVKNNASAAAIQLFYLGNGLYGGLIINNTATNTAQFVAYNTAGDTLYINAQADLGVIPGTTNYVIGTLSFDLADTAKRDFTLLGGTGTVNWATYVNALIDIGRSDVRVGASGTGSHDRDASFLYISTDYIDFTDETNRLKFIDGLGYPVDIQAAIDNEDIPTPLIYMPFDDSTNLGKNNGTSGDFTVNGTVIQGADVDPS